MLRRVHTPRLRTGDIELDAAGARHVRDVLRLTEGTEVEVFDDAGAIANGVIVRCQASVVVHVEAISAMPESATPALTIASAVPKGERADWMVEKLSELGCTRFIPLAAARSVVLPEGKNKLQRWNRIATESAKQSRRRGVMRIDELTSVNAALDLAKSENARIVVLSTDPQASPLSSAPAATFLFIGPEGGWTEQELELFQQRGATSAKLTDTVLRVETAAIVAAAIVLLPVPSPLEGEG
jgi:16S rRNA (uracil1498-N3)-methyltransferase